MHWGVAALSHDDEIDLPIIDVVLPGHLGGIVVATEVT
jgi:hypothetical protein